MWIDETFKICRSQDFFRFIYPLVDDVPNKKPLFREEKGQNC